MPAVGNFVSAHTMKANRGIRGVAALILNLGTRFRWAVNFIPSSTLPLRKNPASRSVGRWVVTVLTSPVSITWQPATMFMHYSTASIICSFFILNANQMLILYTGVFPLVVLCCVICSMLILYTGVFPLVVLCCVTCSMLVLSTGVLPLAVLCCVICSMLSCFFILN